MVYRLWYRSIKKILEFYKAACDILTRKGAKLITTITFKNARFTDIVQDFLRYAESLHKIVQVVIADILGEINHMVCDNHSKFSCPKTCLYILTCA